MSGAQTSTGPDPNILYKALSGQEGIDVNAGLLANQQNQLLMPYRVQAAQQETSAADMEQVARASAYLATLPPEQRPSAYSQILPQLKAQGFAKNAPDAYPGDDIINYYARQGTPSATQAEWAANIAANKAYGAATGGNQTATPPAAPGGGGTPKGAIDPAQMVSSIGTTLGVPNDDAAAIASNFHAESGLMPGINEIRPVVPGSRGGYGLAQWTGPRRDALEAFAAQNKMDVSDPATQLAFMKQDIAQNYPDLLAHMAAAKTPEDKAAVFFREYESGGAPGLQPLQGRHTANAAAFAALPPPAVPGAGGVAARTGGTDVASNAPMAPATATAPATQPPAAASQPTYTDPETGLPVLGTPPGAQNVLAPPPPPAARPATASPAAARAPGTATAPPPALPPTPAGSPGPPQLQPLNARGLTAQQQAQLDAAASTGRLTLQDRIKQEQALAQLNIGNQQKAFSDWIATQQLATSQGQLSVSQANSALEYWKAAHPDAKVTMTGGEIITQDPRSGQEIAPRIQVTPQRADTAAMAIVSRLGPKVADGTATPEEQSQYAVAVDSYRQPTLRENPLTKETVRVNTRELPAGFPEPPTLGSGRPGAPGGGPQTVIPGQSIAQQAVEKQLGEDFAGKDTKAYAGANNSLYSLGQMNNAAEVLDRTPGSWTATGPTANIRLGLGQAVNTLGSLFGMQPQVDPAAIGNWEALNKQTKLMGFKIINSAFGASREAASVINNATSAVPQSENTYLGFRLVSSGIEQELARERELYEYKAQLVNQGKPLATAEADFNKTHPVDDYTKRAISNAVPDDMAGYLTAHPDTVKAFDAHFGPGIGEFILKGGRTGMGTEARRQ